MGGTLSFVGVAVEVAINEVDGVPSSVLVVVEVNRGLIMISAEAEEVVAEDLDGKTMINHSETEILQ